ncbi:hypothetical protein AOL_s00091g56 [Orbilia oligospora ATCC 24927]|uniref:Uncharacterized protein n=1 Tax=Arthrobotrys oligospora (strain ATCC 24927 / CBS 115.81 / DSM 1491) TaxID=756982 RepID=G1XI04_ARTOA|nr:hypothetical protein AOL_s00091g56 [Orbilia oligospora ATCC 24927]EGX47235.1 hypothetical protein AOL_s00091g56 [Orbilia oligospora ATCC 24927]
MSSLGKLSDVLRLVDKYEKNPKLKNPASASHYGRQIASACDGVEVNYDPDIYSLHYIHLVLQLDRIIKKDKIRSLSLNDVNCYSQLLEAMLIRLVKKVTSSLEPKVALDVSDQQKFGEDLDDIKRMVLLIGGNLTLAPSLASGAIIMLRELCLLAIKLVTRSQDGASRLAQNCQAKEKRKRSDVSTLRVTRSESSGPPIQPRSSRRTTRSQARAETKRPDPAEIIIIDEDGSHNERKRLKIKEITDDNVKAEVEDDDDEFKVEDITEIDKEDDEFKIEDTADNEDDEFKTEDITDNEDDEFKTEDITDNEDDESEIKETADRDDDKSSEIDKFRTCVICGDNVSNNNSMSHRFKYYLRHVTKSHPHHYKTKDIQRHRCHVCSAIHPTQAGLTLHAGIEPGCGRHADHQNWEPYGLKESLSPAMRFVCTIPSCSTVIHLNRFAYHYQPWLERVESHLAKKHGRRLIVTCGLCPNKSFETIQAMVKHRKLHGLTSIHSRRRELFEISL